MIESKFQAYCQGEMSCHGEFVVGGEDVVLDYQHMVQYTQTALFASPTTCRIKRVQVTMDMKIKLTAHQCMEVEHMALFGLQEMAAEEAYNTWTHTFHSLAMARQPHDAFQTSGTQLYRVLSEKSPVHSFPSLSASISTYVLYGEIVAITCRHGRWGCLGHAEAWCLIDSHQPSFFPISQARAAAQGTVPWLPGLSEAQSLRIEFDPRTVRTNWKLLFFKDAACTQRWPYVLSRDGFAPFIVPASHFYYTFQPDTTKTHFVPEWGYAFARPTWSLWTAVQTHKSLQDMLITTDGAGSTWLQSILRYIRTPAAPDKVRVLSTLVLCLHRNRTRLPAALQPHLASFLWFVQPELNFLYRKSVKWRLHSNPYFQTLLQAVTSVSSVAEHRIQRVGAHVFGYHAEMHRWHQELIETVKGLDVMLPATWQPIIAKQFNPLTMLKQLFKQFEASIKTDVQRWHKNRRELWIRQVDQAYHPALLSQCLCVFNETLLPASRECGWATERNKWLRHVQAACTVGDVAMQLMVLAGFIDVESHTSSWGSQSYDWRKAVMGLTKTDLAEDAQLHVSGQWTDGHVVADNDLSASVAIDRMFEDSTKLFRVRQAENVHVIAAFEYKTSLIRKINVRLRKTYSNNSTPVTAGMIFVFPVYPTPEDMLKVGHYDYFTSDKYQSYVLNMRRRGLLPLPGDPVAYFDVTSPHYCQGNAVTVVPDFAVLGQYVVVKLLRCYNIRVMEDLADVIKRQEDH
ncbi:hypothetical protein DYB31_012246, partial [Aphanomyces astaci]